MKKCTKIPAVSTADDREEAMRCLKLSTQQVDEKTVKRKLYTNLSTLSTILNRQDVDFRVDN